ncbi:hypothetical protein GCM10007860_11580 [Chitiniphilus shinanonensis]|uniref:DUF937 domain-containing protein n=1 Tax=Chitiniphilus shinanonensis TaxID=553088 RepID=A0ABQ6BUZ9_9NEIS|nr:YidB family protein [Chitiniphilus shinanonensis]GLS04012.1 hypothetical protein GCM10007860_11580 [Chitiniphilus shinanonensis]
MLEQLSGLFGGGGGSNVASLATDLLQREGGVAGLVERFQNGGLAEVAQSWVGTGGNLPISPEQIQSVLGSDVVRQLADKVGIDPQAAAGHLAELLPQVVDKLTPNGQLPAEGGGDALSLGLGALGKLFK